MNKNLLNVLKQLQRDKAYLEQEEKTIKDAFEKIKREIIEEFNNHPVTIEMEMGITAENISGTLSGITNLYSFIGFREGEKPVEPIRELLEKSTYRIIRLPGIAKAKFSFDTPTAKEIFKETPMPPEWSVGRSWAKGIETGISGIGYYLRTERGSRSGFGIQAKNKTRRGIRFKNIKYISYLINKFEKELKKIDT